MCSTMPSHTVYAALQDFSPGPPSREPLRQAIREEKECHQRSALPAHLPAQSSTMEGSQLRFEQL